MPFIKSAFKGFSILLFSIFIIMSTVNKGNSVSINLPSINRAFSYDKLKYYDLCYPKMLEVFTNHNIKMSDEWKQIDLDKNNSGDFFTNKDTGFEATAFTRQKTIAIVIRGMHLSNFTFDSFWRDKDGTSARSIFFGNMGVPLLGKVPAQFNDAIAFYKIVKKNFPDYKIVLVGKSLGGSLAELLGAIYGDDTYTFASPGMYYAVPKLPKDLQERIAQNSQTRFTYIKTYYNINDPCGGYGRHIGLSFVYPPIKNYKNFFSDVHGNIKNFASEDAISKIRAIPPEWADRHAAALIYYDSKFVEKPGIFSLHKFIKIRYRVEEKDFFEAEKIVNKLFDLNDDKSS